MQVGTPGVAARKPAPVLVPIGDGAALRRGRLAVAAADVEQGAVVVVEHPADRRGAGDPLGGGGADGGAVFEVAAARGGGGPAPPVGTLCTARVGVRGGVGGVVVGGRFGGRAGRRMGAARRGRVA